MAHIVLICGGLVLRPAQGSYLRLGLFQLTRYLGTQQLRLGPPLKLPAVGGGIDHIKHSHHREQNFRCHLESGIGIAGDNGIEDADGDSVILDIIHDGQAAKKKQGLWETRSWCPRLRARNTAAK